MSTHDPVFGPQQPGPFGTTLAELIGGKMVYEPGIGQKVIHADGHIITESFTGRVTLDGHSPAAVILGWHSEGAERVAAAFRIAVGAVAA